MKIKMTKTMTLKKAGKKARAAANNDRGTDYAVILWAAGYKVVTHLTAEINQFRIVKVFKASERFSGE